MIYHVASLVFHCFLHNPFICLVATSREVLESKTQSHPSLLSRQVKTLIFYLKNYHIITIKSPILHFAPMRSHNTPYCPEKGKNHFHLACYSHLYPSRWILLTKNCCLGPRYTYYYHKLSSNCTGLLFCSLLFCVLKWFKYLKIV